MDFKEKYLINDPNNHQNDIYKSKYYKYKFKYLTLKKKYNIYFDKSNPVLIELNKKAKIYNNKIKNKIKLTKEEKIDYDKTTERIYKIYQINNKNLDKSIEKSNIGHFVYDDEPKILILESNLYKVLSKISLAKTELNAWKVYTNLIGLNGEQLRELDITENAHLLGWNSSAYESIRKKVISDEWEKLSSSLKFINNNFDKNCFKLSFWEELYNKLPYKTWNKNNPVHIENGKLMNERLKKFSFIINQIEEFYIESIKKNDVNKWFNNNKINLTDNLKDDYYYGEIITIDDDTNIHYIGDIHGSLHSLIMILYKMRQNNIIDNNFKLKPNNVIIFTGDLVDYSYLSIEVLILVFILKLANNNDNIFICDGNHEDYATYSLPQNDFKNELNKSDIIIENQDKLMRILQYLPTVLFVKYNKKIFQFNHGSHPNSNQIAELVKNFLQSDKKYINLNEKPSYLGYKKLGEDYKWGDFGRLTRRRRAGRYQSDLDQTKTYLEKTNIECIFSGHQDTLPMSILTDSSENYITVAKGKENENDDGIFIFKKKVGQEDINTYELHSFVDRMPQFGDSMQIDNKTIINPDELKYQYLFNVTRDSTKNISKMLGENNSRRVYATVLSSASISQKFIRYSSYATLKKI